MINLQIVRDSCSSASAETHLPRYVASEGPEIGRTAHAERFTRVGSLVLERRLQSLSAAARTSAPSEGVEFVPGHARIVLARRDTLVQVFLSGLKWLAARQERSNRAFARLAALGVIPVRQSQLVQRPISWVLCGNFQKRQVGDMRKTHVFHSFFGSSREDLPPWFFPLNTKRPSRSLAPLERDSVELDCSLEM